MSFGQLLFAIGSESQKKIIYKINPITVNEGNKGHNLHDFKDFVKRIKIDISSKEVRKEKYDKVYEIEKLKESIKK